MNTARRRLSLPRIIDRLLAISSSGNLHRNLRLKYRSCAYVQYQHMSTIERYIRIESLLAEVEIFPALEL